MGDYQSVVQSQFLVGKGGQMVEHLVRVGTSHCRAFIDQLTYVVDLDALSTLDGQVLFSEIVKYQEVELFQMFKYLVHLMSEKMIEIFGFGVTEQRTTGLNFYDYSFQLGTKQCNYGYVCVGGNRKTLCVSITATGLLAAKEGWEKRLYDFANLFGSSAFKFTRVDVARDFFNGEYNIISMLNDYYNNLFKIKGATVNPILNKVGSDWFNDTKKGKTLYIGSRHSSRYLRGYEKGKQLGDKTSNWFRVELELRARDLVIPFDILLSCGDYLTMYPAFRQHLDFWNCIPEHISNIKRVKKELLKENIATSIKYLLIQGGKVVNFLFGMGKSDAEIGEMFRDYLINKNKFNTVSFVPKGLHVGQFMAERLFDAIKFETGQDGNSIYYTTQNF